MVVVHVLLLVWDLSCCELSTTEPGGSTHLPSALRTSQCESRRPGGRQMAANTGESALRLGAITQADRDQLRCVACREGHSAAVER